MEGKARRHGLQLPLDAHQVASYVVFSFLAAGVYVFFLPFVNAPATRYALVAVYSLLVLLVFSLAFVASVTDPSDPGLYTPSDGEFYCSICQASVGRTSKHCKSCNRCVSGFDHHCKWLNNCIGARNYRAFFSLVVLTVTLLILQLGWGAWLFACSFYNATTMMQLVDERYGLGHLNYRGWQATLVIYLLLLAAAILMLGELLSFHAVLIAKNMSTFDYIVAQRQLQTTGSSGPVNHEGGARTALCGRSNRITDVTGVVAPQRRKISLNPCTACSTIKLEGNPHTWQVGGKGVPAGSQGSAAAEALVGVSQGVQKDLLQSTALSDSLDGQGRDLIVAGPALRQLPAAIVQPPPPLKASVSEPTVIASALYVPVALKVDAGAVVPSPESPALGERHGSAGPGLPGEETLEPASAEPAEHDASSEGPRQTEEASSSGHSTGPGAVSEARCSPVPASDLPTGQGALIRIPAGRALPGVLTRGESLEAAAGYASPAPADGGSSLRRVVRPLHAQAPTAAEMGVYSHLHVHRPDRVALQ